MEDKIHIGIIPDGNRRYAKKHRISLEESYNLGVDKFINICEWAKEYNISEISFYALSKENLNRNKTQLNVLFKIFKKKIDQYLDKFNNDRTYFIKFYGNIPKELSEKIREIESKNTEDYKIKVNILLGYSGRDEIIKAINEIIKERINKIDENNFRKFLFVNKDLDLIIRTGGYQRLSNFLIFQSAYSELYFTDKLWNEFTKKDFEDALKWYKKQKRNFGR